MGTIRLSATSQIRCLKVGKLPSWKHVLASVRGLLNTFWLSDIHLDTCCEIVFDPSNDTSTGKNSSFLSRSDILPGICSVLSSALYYDILCAVLTFRLTHEIVWKERTPKSTHLSNMVLFIVPFEHCSKPCVVAACWSVENEISFHGLR